MPQLSDLIGKRKFVKKSYRPWDLSGSGSNDNQNKAEEITQPSAASETAIHQEPIETKSQIKEDIITQTTVTIEEKITGNKIDNNHVTTKKHPDNIQVTSLKQLDNKEVTSRQQISNDLDNITGNAKDMPYLIEAIKKLTGIQKNLFLYIINTCTARGTLDTGNILSSDLANASYCSIGSAKTSLNRLVDKHLIIRYQGKACRGGHMVLGITKEIQAAAIQAQLALFNPLKSSHPDNITSNIIGNTNTYSSSIYNKNTTTSLPEEWKKVDLALLNEIGFSETQLRQLYQSNATTPEIVQESIHHFAYGLEHNPKLKSYSDPLNVLMGVLRKGGNWIEKNYISAKEQALLQLLEQKKREAERIQLLENKILDEEYKIWLGTLTTEVKENLLKDVPKSSMLSKTLADKANEGYLLQHFKMNVYGK